MSFHDYELEHLMEDPSTYRKLIEEHPEAADKFVSILGRMIGEAKGDRRVNVWLAEIGGCTGIPSFTVRDEEFFVTVDEIWPEGVMARGDDGKTFVDVGEEIVGISQPRIPSAQQVPTSAARTAISHPTPAVANSPAQAQARYPQPPPGHARQMNGATITNVAPPRLIPRPADDPRVNGPYGSCINVGVPVISWANQVSGGKHGGSARVVDGVLVIPCSKSKGVLEPWWCFKVNPATGIAGSCCYNHNKERAGHPLNEYFPVPGQRNSLR